jgi:putative NADPH-quinone reductase
MRVQVIWAHPVETSFTGAIHSRVVETLGRGGHEVIDTDLYKEGFQPALSREERVAYYGPEPDTSAVQEYVDKLKWAEALVFCFPVWWHDVPAMLKGYLERVWVPGVAFHLPEGGGPLRPGLTHIRKFAVVATYGAPWWYARLYVGDPARRIMLRGLKPLLGKGARHLYLAHYGMDRTTAEKRARFLARVERAFERF